MKIIKAALILGLSAVLAAGMTALSFGAQRQARTKAVKEHFVPRHRTNHHRHSRRHRTARQVQQVPQARSLSEESY